MVDFGVPYDFASIMHYPFTAFSKNGKPTIRNIVDMQGKTPYVELSDGDAKQTNSMYKCNGKKIRGFNMMLITCWATKYGAYYTFLGQLLLQSSYFCFCCCQYEMK